MKVKGIRERNGRYYARIRGREYALNTVVGQEVEAVIEFGRIKQRLENGEDVAGFKRKASALSYPKDDTRGRRIWEMHLQPFLKQGGYKIQDIDETVISQYIRDRWGDKPTSTIDREFQVLRSVMQSILPEWKIPEVSYHVQPPSHKSAIGKEVIHEAGREMELLVRNPVEAQAFWVMAYTGMEPMDVAQLAPCHFKGGMVIKVRSKTAHHKHRRTVIKVPVISKLMDIIKKRPWPLDPNQPILSPLKPKNLTTNVKRAFDNVLYSGKTTGQMADLRKKEGLEMWPSYGTKDVRRYVITALHMAGYTQEQIQPFVGHIEGSRVTQDYIKVPDQELIKMFERAF